MSRPRGYRPVVWLRRLLLVALVAFLGVVSGLLIKGRDDRPGIEEPPAIAETLRSGEGVEIRAGTGFSHQVTEDGEPRYEIAASSWSATRDELIKLDDVVIRFDRGDGEEYTIEAASGHYQQAGAIATLVGDVRIRNVEGFQISGPGFSLERGGTLIVSTEGPVHFRYQDRFAGSARELRSNLRRKRSEISGDAHIWSLAGQAVDASLTARRLLFEQRDNMIHAEGGVVLRRDGEELTARRISIELDEEGERPVFVRARWQVAGSRPQFDEGVPRTLRFAADQLSVVFAEDGGGPERAELEGSGSTPARLEVAGADGEVRRIETPYLVAEFAGGAIASADVLGPVGLTDFLAFDPDQALVTGCADAAEARFHHSGELATIVLDGGVEFNRPEAQISGNVVETKADGEVVVSGRPARVHSTRGSFEAPQILYRPDEGTGLAKDGVRATLEGRDGLGLMTDGDAAREPIRITARTAQWSDDDGAVTFQQEVRAWQEENYLTANELEVGAGGKSMAAKGAVTTVIKQAREEGEESSPLYVTAAELEFDGETDVIHYTGSPRARRAGRSLACLELDVELDGGGGSEVERMICSGNAMIESPADGQTVSGEQALYLPGSESIEVSGNPVVLRSADGRQVRGARVVYDLETGQATVLTSGDPGGGPVG